MFVSPAMIRSLRRRKKASAYARKQFLVKESKQRAPEKELPLTPLDTVFDQEWEVVDENTNTNDTTKSEGTETTQGETEYSDEDSEEEDDAGED